MDGISQKFIELVHNRLFWWPFIALRPEHGQKMSIKNISVFLFLYSIFMGVIGLLIIWLIYWPFADLIGESGYIYWTIVLVTLAMGLLFNAALYSIWTFLWNKEIN